MSLQTTIQLVLTVASSLLIVVLVISLGWFLIWKAFLSKFRLVRELLGQTNDDLVINNEKREKQPKVRKIRKE